jgi:hypothetical protein
MRLLHDRWTIAIAGAIVMLLIGTIYSWTIFTEPLLVAFGWDLTTRPTNPSRRHFELQRIRRAHLALRR